MSRTKEPRTEIRCVSIERSKRIRSQVAPDESAWLHDAWNRRSVTEALDITKTIV